MLEVMFWDRTILIFGTFMKTPNFYTCRFPPCNTRYSTYGYMCAIGNGQSRSDKVENGRTDGWMDAAAISR